MSSNFIKFCKTAAKAKMDEEEENKEDGGDDDGMVVENEELDENAKKKAEKAAKKARKAEKEAKKLAKEKNGGSDDGEDKQDEKGDKNNAEEEDEVFYGAPDDHAWTDASHAIKESEKNKDDGPDTSVSYTLAAHHTSLNASLNSTCN